MAVQSSGRPKIELQRSIPGTVDGVAREIRRCKVTALCSAFQLTAKTQRQLQRSKRPCHGGRLCHESILTQARLLGWIGCVAIVQLPISPWNPLAKPMERAGQACADIMHPRRSTPVDDHGIERKVTRGRRGGAIFQTSTAGELLGEVIGKAR